MQTLKALLRIAFLRGSPERILYGRGKFIAGLLLALVAAGAAQYFYHADHLVFALLRVFAEVTIFMMWMVLLTAKVARLRLATLMLSLVGLSLLSDGVLLLLAVPFQLLAVGDVLRDVVAFVWGAAICYGAGSAVGWALHQRSMNNGILHVIGYVVVVAALEVSFRYLYNIMAA